VIPSVENVKVWYNIKVSLAEGPVWRNVDGHGVFADEISYGSDWNRRLMRSRHDVLLADALVPCCAQSSSSGGLWPSRVGR
jgi:hypothetical protein